MIFTEFWKMITYTGLNENVNKRPGPNTKHESMWAWKKAGARTLCWWLAVRWPCVSGDGQHLFAQQHNLGQLLHCSDSHLGCLQCWWWNRRAVEQGTLCSPGLHRSPHKKAMCHDRKANVCQHLRALFCTKEQGSCKSLSSKYQPLDRGPEEDCTALCPLRISVQFWLFCLHGLFVLVVWCQRFSGVIAWDI